MQHRERAPNGCYKSSLGLLALPLLIDHYCRRQIRTRGALTVFPMEESVKGCVQNKSVAVGFILRGNHGSGL